MDNKLHKNKFVVGLTGGIACGKSSIASLFEKLGITVVDADLIARAVVEKGSPILLELQQAFGSPDGKEMDGVPHRYQDAPEPD